MLNLPICHWSSQLFDLREPSSTDVPVLLLNQPNNKDSTRAQISREACLQESTLRSEDGDGNENIKKAKGLITKTTTLHVHHAFLNISLPSLHDYDVTMPNFTFYRESTKAKTKFPLSF